jgi:hypothetical protein
LTITGNEPSLGLKNMMKELEKEYREDSEAQWREEDSYSQGCPSHEEDWMLYEAGIITELLTLIPSAVRSRLERMIMSYEWGHVLPLTTPPLNYKLNIYGTELKLSVMLKLEQLHSSEETSHRKPESQKEYQDFVISSLKQGQMASSTPTYSGGSLDD